MCTLIAFHEVWANAPLVIAVNRDEEYARPARQPRWEDTEPAVLTPRDETAGGTWMGANAGGLWVGLTNRYVGLEEDPGRRSRGLLCRELLDAPNAATAVDRIDRLDESYNPFNLVVGDGSDLFAIEYGDGEASSRPLSAGCHVVTNRALDDTRDEPKAHRAWSLLEASGLLDESGRSTDPPSDLASRLTAILGDHGQMGEDAICLHGGRYGTRSAAVWTLKRHRVELTWSDGPPCSAPFQQMTPQP